MIHTTTIRLTAEPSTKPGLQWLRLMLDEPNDRAETLDQMVLNFTAPIAIADPKHVCDVPNRGQPARGWVEKLQVRAGLEGLELWGGVAWIDQLKDVCSAGSLWARIVVDQNALDPRTGASLGAKLRSIELAAPPSLLESRKEDRIMTTANTASAPLTTEAIIAKLSKYEGTTANRALDVERCILEEDQTAKHLSRDALYATRVHPVMVALGAERMRSAARAGTPMRASTVGTAPSSTPTTTRQQLDVRGYDGPTKFAKLMTYVRSVNATLSHEGVFALACNLNRSHEVIG